MPLINYPPINYPRMLRVSQKFDSSRLENIPQKIVAELDKIQIKSQIKPDATVALMVGSRGITDIVTVIKTIADELKKIGAKPFIIPSMGSHGGATASGQQAILKHLGLTEETVGIPIRSTMEVIPVGEISEFGTSFPVYVDQYAYEADHIVVINRIKPHTDFSGDFGSGWMKMMSIGLGDHRGALLYHRVIASYGYANVIKKIAQKVLDTGKILFCVGIIENAYGATADIGTASAKTLVQTECELLKKAKKHVAHLPFEEVDLLIVDQMGKDISGSGMEPTVHGRLNCLSEPPLEKPKIKRIFVRDLTPGSEGNALGIGFADFTTKRLVEKIDYQATYINCITGMDPEDGRIPISFETDQEAIDVALNTIGFIEPENTKVIWIKNTLCLEEIVVSQAYQKQLNDQDNLAMLEDLGQLKFNSQGNLSYGL